MRIRIQLFPLMRIRIQLFTLMRIRILFLIKSYGNLQPQAPFLSLQSSISIMSVHGPPGRYFEPLKPLDFYFMRIRIQLPKIMRIPIRSPVLYLRFSGNRFMRSLSLRLVWIKNPLSIPIFYCFINVCSYSNIL
jgi:hypothetical protein